MKQLDHPIGTTRYLKFKDEVLEITYCADGLWRSPDGCIFGYMEDSFVTDKKMRFGVGLLSLPEDDPLSLIARPHDYKYSCPVYQLYHTRAEADKDLQRDIATLSGWRKYAAKPAYWLSRLFGWIFWENEKTK